MRIQNLSIAVWHHSDGTWTVAIVEKLLRAGQVVREDVVAGPRIVSEAGLKRAVLEALEGVRAISAEYRQLELDAERARDRQTL